MNKNSFANNTSLLIEALVKTKEIEKKHYEVKVLELKKETEKTSHDFVKKYKYILAKNRYDQLMSTTQELCQLEQEIKKLQVYSDTIAI